jgi:hypothetical protein
MQSNDANKVNHQVVQACGGRGLGEGIESIVTLGLLGSSHLGNERLLPLAESRATVVASSRNDDALLVRTTGRAHGGSEAIDAAL